MTIRLTLVPHTHWDREWYAPFDEFSERLVVLMDTLIELGRGGFPHFHLDGQTAMVDDYLTVRPEREVEVRTLAREGRLSLGPWVTQMDEFLVSGESHVRNLERGLERARSLGPALEVGYLPDQFGHIGQMPQILRMFGIDRAVVWRGVPRSIDRDAFWWESPDGSRVMTEYLAFGYASGEPLRRIEDPAALAKAIADAVERQRPLLTAGSVLAMVGSDHTGPDPTLPQRLAAAADHLDDVLAEIGDLDRHLEHPKTAPVPTWTGELRSSARAHLLPNVYSARVHQKRERGRVEALIERYAEPLAVLVPGFDWPERELDRAWTLLLWNGAHDSACGCSHDRVALDVDARFAEVRAIGERIVAGALASLGSQTTAGGVIRFNPSPFERDGVPGLGWRVDPAPAPSDERVVRLTAGADGELRAGDLELRFLDEPDVGDLYTFCPAEQGQRPRAPSETTIDGGEATIRFDDDLRIRLRATRRDGEPFLRLDGTIVNRRPDHRLRLHVPLTGAVGGSIAGSPFELVTRPLVSEGSDLEAASTTWPARGYVLAGDLALLHEGVFEYGVVDGRELAVTLLRCVGTISRETLSTRPFPAGPNVPTPLAQMLGETSFSLGSWPGAISAEVPAVWERFGLPLASARASGGGPLPDRGSLLEIGGRGQLASVRRRAGRPEVRMWNARNDAAAAVEVDGRAVKLGPARIETILLTPRAGDGNRTRTTSLEGWSSAIELRPRGPGEA